MHLYVQSSLEDSCRTFSIASSSLSASSAFTSLPDCALCAHRALKPTLKDIRSRKNRTKSLGHAKSLGHGFAFFVRSVRHVHETLIVPIGRFPLLTISDLMSLFSALCALCTEKTHNAQCNQKSHNPVKNHMCTEKPHSATKNHTVNRETTQCTEIPHNRLKTSKRYVM